MNLFNFFNIILATKYFYTGFYFFKGLIMKNLFTKLSKIQASLSVSVKKDQKQYLAYKNGYSREYTIASLPAILKVLNPLLNEASLYMYQSLECGHQEMNVKGVVTSYYYVTVTTHVTDGEDKVDIPGVTQYLDMADYSVQNASTCQTQAKRYSLLSAFNISPEDDVDGNMIEDGWVKNSNKSANDNLNTQPKSESSVSTAQASYSSMNFAPQVNLTTNFNTPENKDKLNYTPSTPKEKSDAVPKATTEKSHGFADANVSVDSLLIEIENAKHMGQLNAIYAKASQFHLSKQIGKAWNNKKNFFAQQANAA